MRHRLVRTGLLAAGVAVPLLLLQPVRPVAADEVGSSAPEIAVDAPPASVEEIDSEFTEPDPGFFDKAFDLGFLRPFGVVQIVASSVFLVIAYPVAVALGGDDELVRACLRDPVYQTFQRPLGRLSARPD